MRIPRKSVSTLKQETQIKSIQLVTRPLAIFKARKGILLRDGQLSKVSVQYKQHNPVTVSSLNRRKNQVELIAQDEPFLLFSDLVERSTSSTSDNEQISRKSLGYQWLQNGSRTLSM